jgi:excisionase family DNA binding protein
MYADVVQSNRRFINTESAYHCGYLWTVSTGEGLMQSKVNSAERPLAYQVNAFCRSIGIGRSKFYDLIKEGKIRTVLVGGRRVVPATEAERLLSAPDDRAA